MTVVGSPRPLTRLLVNSSTAGVGTRPSQDVSSPQARNVAALGLKDTFEQAPAAKKSPARTEAPTPPAPSEGSDPFEGLRDAALLRAIKESSSGKHVKSYTEARKVIFGELDVVNGKVACVYTGREIEGGKLPKNSDMNVEHTWPQSKGATGVAKSDLHHLFPTDSKTNAKRGNWPFGEVVNVKWSENGAKFGTDAQGRTVFEPPDSHKGNVARAMFYFSSTYSKPIPDAEEAVLREWNDLDVVDTAEHARNQRVSDIQGNVNQFVEHEDLVDRIKDF
ncbi:endonuclease [Myxococcus sp. CA033]|nr:endonuclease [Myxococcus sp. CA033]